MILKVLIKMAYIKTLETYMILMVLIEMASINILEIYDLNGFDRNGNHVLTKDKYDPKGFDRNGLDKETKTIYDPEGFDINGYDIQNNRKKSSKIKTSKAKSFEKQKGKGYVNLPIALSKIYANNSSKELINNIKQLINDLYDNKQITKQVYNNLIKAIIYK